jgi:alginate production protein
MNNPRSLSPRVFSIRSACALLVWTLLVLGGTATADQATDETEGAPILSSDPRQIALEETRDPEAHPLDRRGLIARRDRKRLRHPIVVPIFGQELVLSGRLTLDNEVEIDRLRDFDLVALDGNDVDEDGNVSELKDRARGRRPLDDQVNLGQALELDAFYSFTDHSAIYVAGAFAYVERVYADFEPEIERWTLERKEFWLYFGRLFETPLAVQLGGQNYADDRQWWWNEDLDAARLRFESPTVNAEFSAAQQLLPRELGEDRIDPEEDEILRLFGQIEWAWSKDQSLALRVLHQDDNSDGYKFVAPNGDPCVASLPNGGPVSPFFQTGCIDPKREDESDANLTWIGGSAAGRLGLSQFGGLHYWADIAGVFGDETFYDFSGDDSERRVSSRDRHSIQGVGLDLGLVWEPSIPLEPAFTVGYARGSGRHNTSETRQRGFRQTGLQRNKDKFRGVATFKYYGELFDPELANLEIWTFGAGIRFFRESSLDVVYHIYRQDVASEFLRDVGFKRDPFGQNKDVGEEVDVILGIEEWEHFEIKAVFAMFRTGRAFAPGDDKNSFLGSLRFRFNF